MRKINDMREIKDNRESIRVGIRQLTSIIKSRGDYELVQGSDKAKIAKINIVDISMGGLCIESKQILKQGISLELEMPKLKNLDATMVECEVTRSIFREDPLYYKNLGTDQDKSYYETGLKFKIPNTEYLKELYKIAIADQV